jgi:hypothetical protein
VAGWISGGQGRWWCGWFGGYGPPGKTVVRRGIFSIERYMASSMTGWSVDGQSSGDEVARPEDELGRTGEAGAEE